MKHIHDILLRKNLTVAHLDKPEGKKMLPICKLYDLFARIKIN